MTLSGFRVPAALYASAVVLLLAGGTLLAAAWWLRPLVEADSALERGDVARALDGYAAAERRFDRFPPSKRALAGLHRLTLANQLSLLYGLQRYDTVIDKAGTVDDPSAPFWAGCALFAKASLEEKPEARLSWLSQAQEEFRRALELSPDDWDAKFDFEVTARLIAELRKKPKGTAQEMLQLLRPPPKSVQEPVKKVG